MTLGQHLRRPAVSSGDERGVHPQRGRTTTTTTTTVSKAARDRTEVNAGGKQLRSGVVAEPVQARRHADPSGKPAEALRDRIWQHRFTAAWLRAEHVGAGWQAGTHKCGDL